MNRITKQSRRLMLSILTLFLIFGTAPAWAYTEGDVASYEALIPVEIREAYGGKAKIEQLYGTERLPSETVVSADESGHAEFRISFADASAGEISKYRITQVPGTEENVVYDGTSYICEVWIFNADNGKLYARAFLYKADDPVDNPEALVSKPDECLFENKTPPTADNDATREVKGKTQTSSFNRDTFFKEGSGKITSVKLIDPDTGEPTDKKEVPAYAQINGKKVKVGTYTLNSDGTVTYTPIKVSELGDDYFVGKPLPAKLRATDENGLTATAEYQPEVYEGPSATGGETWGKKGEKQTGTVTFTEGDGKIVKVELIDPHTGKPAEPDEKGIYTVDALDENGNVVGKYTLDPSTKRVNADGTISYDVVFTPNADFVGTPLPAEVLATDENGLTATAKYQPHVTEEEKTTESASPKTTAKKTTRSTSASPKTGRSVKTGDDFNPLPYILGMGAALAVILFIVYALRKRRMDGDDE